MLYLVTWEIADASEAGTKRSLAVFQQWQPAAGAEFKGFYGYADNSGGVAIVEADSHATLARLTAPFAPWLRFSARPILPVEEAATIAGEASAWLDTIA
jgi:hypothetical protein